jgi:hypothetical protein
MRGMRYWVVTGSLYCTRTDRMFYGVLLQEPTRKTKRDSDSDRLSFLLHTRKTTRIELNAYCSTVPVFGWPLFLTHKFACLPSPRLGAECLRSQISAVILRNYCTVLIRARCTYSSTKVSRRTQAKPEFEYWVGQSTFEGAM